MASRLIDKLLANVALYRRVKLYKATVFTIDNVFDYLERDWVNHGKSFNNQLELIPKMKIMPPFESIFIQWLHRDGKGRVRELGGLVERIKDDTQWKVEFHFVDENEEFIQTSIELDENGYWANRNVGVAYPPYIPKEDEEYWLDIAYDLLLTSMYGLAFMNCKNTVLEPTEPNAAENKRRTKHGKLPLMRYHVLKIKPFGNRSDNESQGGTHASPALHIRRGHFATYTDDAPLFGKYVGTYWKDQMMVGRKSDRVVVKDYEIDLRQP